MQLAHGLNSYLFIADRSARALSMECTDRGAPQFVRCNIYFAEAIGFFANIRHLLSPSLLVSLLWMIS
jgi:hypothetical protein